MAIDAKATVQLDKRDPFTSWESIDVQFPITPHTDLVIPHSIDVENPRDVHYRIIKQYTAGSIYEPVIAGSKEWTHDYIVLRSDTANWTGRLLLGAVTQIGSFDTTEFDIPESVDGGAGVTTLTGDVTGSGEGTVPTVIGDSTVSFNKLVNLAGPSLIGRESGTGVAQSIAIGEGLQINGTTLKVADSSISLDKLTSMTAGRLVGRRSTSDGSPEAILLGNGLSIAGGTLYFNNIVLGSVTLVANGALDQAAFTAPGGGNFAGPTGFSVLQGDQIRTTAANGGIAIRGNTTATLSGTTDLTLLPNGSTNFCFKVSITSATSTPQLRSMVAPASSMTPGFLRVITNDSVSPFTILHNQGSVGNRFWLPNQRDYTLQPNEQIMFLHTGIGYWYTLSVSRADTLIADSSDVTSGTWTPSLKFGGGTTGMTYTIQTGTYRSHGNMKILQATIRLSAKGSSAGTATLEGLPFTCQATPNHGSVYFAYFDQFASATNVQGYVTGGTAVASLTKDGNTVLTEANFNNTTGFVVTIVIFT